MGLVHPERRPAVVTGASSGIGAAVALELAAQGYPVALGARRAERCEELAEQIRKDGGEAFAHPLDVGDADSVDAFTRAAEIALGPVEILVSSAGALFPDRVHDLDSVEFMEQLNVQLVGAHRLVRALTPGMVERRRGDLVLVSSDVVRAPRTRMGAYVAAKNGVEGMARALQMELEGTGVRASILRPGPTLTEMGYSWDPDVTGVVLTEWVGWGLARHAQFLDPADVARSIVHMVGMPRGAHLTLVEIQPEGPLT